jgi:hypothetical protein
VCEEASRSSACRVGTPSIEEAQRLEHDRYVFISPWIASGGDEDADEATSEKNEEMSVNIRVELQPKSRYFDIPMSEPAHHSHHVNSAKTTLPESLIELQSAQKRAKGLSLR